jgi:hypothetical protein
MKRLIPALALLLLVPCATQAIKVSAFTDIDTFIDRAQDMVIAKCLGPVPDASRYDDGLYPVDVQVLQALKGPKDKSMKPGKAKIATIYAMKAGKTYLLTSMGGSAHGTEFLAVPELSVVELPPSFRLDDLKGKTLKQQVQALFAARRQAVEQQQRRLAEEKKLLDRAVGK